MMINKLKKAVSLEALKYIKSDTIIGIGTGTTVMYFIEALNSIKHKIRGAVSSSDISSSKLKDLGIPLFNLNEVDSLDIYIDSADEINYNMQMIKGGGGALTKEKIISKAAKKFICIVDIRKLVNILGKFPLPIEVIPMAKNLVIYEIKSLGGIPIYRKGVITDNGNIILDVHNLSIFNKDAIALEEKINNIPGVVTVGLFAKRGADIVLIGKANGIKILQ